MFIDNKYKSWHDSIIAKAKVRNKKAIYEKHHIMPKCLGGNNEKSNIVKLTPKEHYIVHMLLCKFTFGYAKHKMLFAFNAMSSLIRKNRTYKLNSRIAEVLKLDFRKLLIGRKFKKETLLKMSKIRKGRKLSEEHKKKIGLAGLGRKFSSESIAKRVSKLKGKKRSQEFKNLISQKNKGKKRTPKQLIKLRAIFKTRKKGLIKLSEEHKRKIGLASIGRQTTLGTKALNKDGRNYFIKISQVDKYLQMGYKLGMINRRVA
jgi:hypothetical protein